MGNVGIFIGLLALFFISINALALTVEPSPQNPQNIILTACDFKLQELLRYDVCLTPATGLNVYYNITKGTGLRPEDAYYPQIPEYKLSEVSPGVYEKIVEKDYLSNDEFWKDGIYTAFTRATDTRYLTYDNTTFYIYPDFPFFYSFLLSGSPEYLNVKWKGSYNVTPGSCVPDRNLSMECYFNGELASEIDPNVRYRPGKEYISTIFSPAYQYYNHIGMTCPPTGNLPCSEYASPSDTISCNSFDPLHPWLNYWNSINFKPIHFKASTIAPSVVTLGEEFTIKVDVSNYGLLADNYTIEVISRNPSVISVVNGHGKIENLQASCPKIEFPTIPPIEYACSPASGSFNAKLIPLVATPADQPVTITINVTSEVSGITLILPSIEVRSGVKSLSEFDWLGILQIIVLATLILVFSKKLL